MAASPENVTQLLVDARRLRYSASRTAICEEAVRIADTLGDLKCGFEARLELIESAQFGGQPDPVIVAFAWCLGAYDRHPDKFGTPEIRDQILWRYKWVIQTLCGYPQFPLAQIDEALADMRARHEAAGHSLQRVFDAERRAALTTGNKPRAIAAFERMCREPLDRMSESVECYHEGKISFYRGVERYAESVAAAEPFVRGEMNCMSGALWACAMTLLPLMKLGQVDRAMSYHRQGLPLVDRYPGFRSVVLYHVDFLTLTDNLDRAVALADKHVAHLLDEASPIRQWGVWSTIRLLADRVREVRPAPIRLTLPDKHPLKTPDNLVVPTELFAWTDREAREIGARFDARDGNDYFAQQINEQAELKAQIVPYPVPSRRSIPGENES
ncbi:hypothetical protein [Fimbriiglobus ruber]|uniref:Uncharacterized protein n=1 Tax=Fimbriiglobus ruber TaxID=1908690 RepID=A0A225DZ90_9BACT|nr:hypothetical protein [Fimbriiglobus ruber]OWK46671.1 hypothetical protein FRUB_00370 [Fimbriiglobus ruber]